MSDLITGDDYRYDEYDPSREVKSENFANYEDYEDYCCELFRNRPNKICGCTEFYSGICKHFAIRCDDHENGIYHCHACWYEDNCSENKSKYYIDYTKYDFVVEISLRLYDDGVKHGKKNVIKDFMKLKPNKYSTNDREEYAFLKLYRAGYIRGLLLRKRYETFREEIKERIERFIINDLVNMVMEFVYIELTVGID